MTQEDYERWMRVAIEAGRANPINPYGCSIVDITRGEVLETGVNHANEDPTNHGETDAIRKLIAKTSPNLPNFRNLILFTTGEPCCMCMAYILYCGFKEVIYGVSFPDFLPYWSGSINLRCREVLARIGTPGAAEPQLPGCIVTGPFLEEECKQLWPALSKK
ncbi:CMP/dCMP deaminase zinc-binding protein [Gonapodya prolifera JEL478]|uniref:CMP/dCMP deaminase zinc-binding protein n=1 Tax=Gonapodya prolifera (strain JEL478) TaxID=1344416 RepID=A0A139AQY8_GONPJ|nr:CMP/dCMP deaminase zinc-binding protein [Gonapodya prolifera JEL478]|eukprot:KXS18933.1 CMP/dCMP deaminase zinc-binding protein [Gonapodya prolifera JEL478]